MIVQPAILAMLLLAHAVEPPIDAPAPQRALVGGRVLVSPAAEPIPEAIVLIEGDTIVAVGRRSEVELPPGAEIVDVAGGTITAGFFNSHVHFYERKWADAHEIPAADVRVFAKVRYTLRDGQIVHRADDE